jgi:hypothetical protein
MWEAWVTGLFGLGGVLLGAGISAVLAVLNRKWQREGEVRQRAVAKSEDIYADLLALERVLRRRLILDPGDLVDREDLKDLRDLLQSIERSCVYLTTPARHRVETVPLLLPDVEELVYRRWVHAPAQVVAHRVINQARKAVECYIRDEKIPPLDAEVASYLVAKKELDAWHDHIVEQQIAEAESGAGTESS